MEEGIPYLSLWKSRYLPVSQSKPFWKDLLKIINVCTYICVCIHINTHFIRYKYIWLSFQVMWRYCRDSCPAASCITVPVVSELRSSIKSLQLFQRLWLCRSYPCPNISILSWNTIGLFLVFFSAVFLKVLELVEREAPKDFCCFVFSHISGVV